LIKEKMATKKRTALRPLSKPVATPASKGSADNGGRVETKTTTQHHQQENQQKRQHIVQQAQKRTLLVQSPMSKVQQLAAAKPVVPPKAESNDSRFPIYRFYNPENIRINMHPGDQGRWLQDLIPVDARGRCWTQKDGKPQLMFVKSCIGVLSSANTCKNGSYPSKACTKKGEAAYSVSMGFGLAASEAFHKCFISKEAMYEEQKNMLAWLCKLQRSIHNKQFDAATDGMHPGLCAGRIDASRADTLKSFAREMGYSEDEITKFDGNALSDVELQIEQRGDLEQFMTKWKKCDEYKFSGLQKKLPVPTDFDVKLEKEREAEREGKEITPLFTEDKPIIVRFNKKVYRPKKGADGKPLKVDLDKFDSDATNYQPPEGFERTRVDVYGNTKLEGKWIHLEPVDETDELLPAKSAVRLTVMFRATQCGLGTVLCSVQRLEEGSGWEGPNPFEDDDEHVTEDAADRYQQMLLEQRRAEEEAEKAKQLALQLDDIQADDKLPGEGDNGPATPPPFDD
jgi:hypothetical protein